MTERNRSGHPSDHEATQQAPTSSSYTPAPVRKTRNVTETHTAVSLESTPHEPHQVTNSSTMSEYNPNTPHVSEPVARPSSIQLNLDTFDQSAHELIEKERQAQNKLSEFEPFSVTPYSTPNPSTDSQSDYASGGPWSQHTSPAPYPESSSEYHDLTYEPLPDLYRSRRRALTLLTLLGIALACFIAMLMQVGVDRLLKDPYGEMVKLVTQSDDASEQSVLTKLTPDTKVIVEQARALAQIDDIQMIDKGIYLVRGLISNRGDESISAALLKLTMRHPRNAKTPWIQRFEFNCCQDTIMDDLSKSERRALIKSLRAGEMKQEGMISLSGQRRQTFTFLAALDASIHVERDEQPRVEIEVVFAE